VARKPPALPQLLTRGSTLADDLDNEDCLNAAGHQMTYLNDVCHVDPANPVDLAPPTTG